MQVTSINGLLKVVTKTIGVGGCHLLPSATCSIFYGALVVDHWLAPANEWLPYRDAESAAL